MTPNRILRLLDRGGWAGFALTIGLGLGVSFGQAPFGLWPIALIALSLGLLRLSLAPSVRVALRRAMAFGFGYGLLTFVWIVEPFLVDATRDGWMAPFAIVAMAAGFGAFWGLGGALGWSVIAQRGSIAGLFAIAAGLAATELLRSFVLTGFPWALLGYIWIETPIYGLARAVGPHGVTLLTLFGAALSACLFVRIDKWTGSGALIAFVAAILCWVWPTPQPNIGTDQTWIIRLVQPNAPQHQKWDPEWRDVFFQRQLDLSGQAGAPDLVIWPEVAVTFRLDHPDAPYGTISQAAGNVPVVLGGQRIEAGKVYNSVLTLDSTGQPSALYDKHHLVPFGEYFPGGVLAKSLGLRGLAQQLEFGFQAGPGADFLEVAPNLRALPMICYEAIFPHELRGLAPDRPDFLLHLTNDAWFGEFSGPYQHLAQARARAIEFGLPLVRVANTGVSGLYDANGQTVDQIPLGTAGHIDIRLPFAFETTHYWRFGDIPAVMALIVTILGLLAMRRRIRIDLSNDAL